MASPNSDSPADDRMLADFFSVLGTSRVLPQAQVDQLRERVQMGNLPAEPAQLARRLVQDEVLTEYQANRILRNKPQGLVIGKYILLEKLGSGSMGRVYKARHTLMDRSVALKIIAPEISTNKRGVARFRREMQLVGRLDDPNVVRAYDADQIGNTLMIVMEYVQGQSLGQILKRQGPLSAQDVIGYAIQAAHGLGHAHAQGIVHRDIKPNNLMVGEDRRLRVLDLGLGFLLEPDPQSAFMTADGIAVGTVDYMSPEQACGGEVDGRSDIYSLGCTIFTLITGLPVFPGESKVDRMLARVKGTPPKLSSFVEELPDGLEEVLNKMLARDPARRFQTAEAVATAFEGLFLTQLGPISAINPSTPARPGPFRKTAPNSLVDLDPGPDESEGEGSQETALETRGGLFDLLQVLVDRPALAILLLGLSMGLSFLIGFWLGQRWRA